VSSQIKPVLLVLLLQQITLLSQTDFTDVQTFIDSNITTDFFYTTFDNNRNGASLISRLNYYKKIDKINYFLKNYYFSSVTRLNRNFYRDFDNIRGGAGYDVSPGINISANYAGQFFSDQRTFQLNATSTNRAYLSTLYEGMIGGTRLHSMLDAGYKVETQYDEIDRGPSVSGDFSIYNLSISDFLVDGQLALGYEALNPRKNSLIYSRLFFERPFNNALAGNEFDGIYSRIRKDFYFPSDPITRLQYGVNNNIQTRIESIYKFLDRFDYTISDNTAFVLSLNPNYKRVTIQNAYMPLAPTLQPSIYDTDIQELSVSGDAALNFQFDELNFQLKAFYLERDEKHSLLNSYRIAPNFVGIIEDNEATKNNHSTLVRLNSNFYYDVNLRSRFELSASVSLLTYDTQSEENYDDRDELGYLVYLAYRFNNLSNLILVTSVDLNLYHTVYIFQQKSSNNNWNRVIRFTSKGFFEPTNWLRNVSAFSILANYTVYDFQDIVSDVKSYSFRQLDLKDSLIVRFSRHFGASIFAEMKIYERGELNWSSFTERPINYFEDKIIAPKLSYFFNRFITLSAGYRVFDQSRFNYVNGNREFDNYVKTYGPFTSLNVEWQANSNIEILGSYDYYKYGKGSPGSENINLYINANWNF
jgi:hypothetical protein